MDTSKLVQQMDQAINDARKWAESGWPMRFGRNDVLVSSLSAAKQQSERFVNGQEALAYWRSVEEAGQESAAQGERAKQALLQGDQRLAEGALYFAAFIEKRLNRPTQTWEPVLASLRSAKSL
ncbi:hypothetical protein [Candidatus Magnetaquicoccus inordinatus]|uniref:hypothetical protein n=1 Tax=Candidatus Magnetaquicoccus inordinatus TaxID=2496818 RepID=UPI00102B7D21|nr:hypothetical protein [Candidatus Magnetaquicoccus inordinatus]